MVRPLEMLCVEQNRLIWQSVLKQNKFLSFLLINIVLQLNSIEFFHFCLISLDVEFSIILYNLCFINLGIFSERITSANNEDCLYNEHFLIVQLLHTIYSG